jgi:hypothetical protein
VQQQQQQQMMQQQGVQYLTMAQGTEGGAPSLAGPNGQQVIPLPLPPSSFLFSFCSYFVTPTSIMLLILFLLPFPSRLFTTPANSPSFLLLFSFLHHHPFGQPAYYVQQPVYLDQNGQPVYYRVGTYVISRAIHSSSLSHKPFDFIFITLTSSMPCNLFYLHSLIPSLHRIPLLSHTANQSGQYQQQDGQMIYGVPNQQEGVNPLGDPLQVPSP